MIDRELVSMCSVAIEEDLGSLDDLPYEVANTVANIYYKYHENIINFVSGNTTYGDDPILAITGMTRDAAQCKADKNTIKHGIKTMREELSKEQQPNAYKAACDLVLDIWKYKIDNVQKKIGLRRMIERKLNKHKVDEIPNLIDILMS